jgi:hypothetical protein
MTKHALPRPAIPGADRSASALRHAAARTGLHASPDPRQGLRPLDSRSRSRWPVRYRALSESRKVNGVVSLLAAAGAAHNAAIRRNATTHVVTTKRCQTHNPNVTSRQSCLVNIRQTVRCLCRLSGGHDHGENLRAVVSHVTTIRAGTHWRYSLSGALARPEFGYFHCRSENGGGGGGGGRRPPPPPHPPFPFLVRCY